MEEDEDIETQERLEAKSDGFKEWMLSKRANGKAKAVIRRVYAPNCSPGIEENVLIMDSATDQSVIGQGFKIMFYTGQQIRMDGALVGMEGSQYPIVCAAAMVEDQTSDQPIIIVVNQAAYNEDLKQHESLLHTDQARFHGVKINDLASCFKDGHGYVGKQSLETEGWSIPLLHDGSKYYLKI
jgi:hypothetical protein